MGNPAHFGLQTVVQSTWNEGDFADRYTWPTLGFGSGDSPDVGLLRVVK